MAFAANLVHTALVACLTEYLGFEAFTDDSKHSIAEMHVGEEYQISTRRTKGKDKNAVHFEAYSLVGLLGKLNHEYLSDDQVAILLRLRNMIEHPKPGVHGEMPISAVLSAIVAALNLILSIDQAKETVRLAEILRDNCQNYSVR